jgi:hypothetical protein
MIFFKYLNIKSKEIEHIKQKENEEKQKLKAQINNEKKLTEEVGF